MALTFRSTVNCALTTGPGIAHGLGAVPNEVFAIPVGTGAATGFVMRPVASAHDATNLYLVGSSAAISADVVARVAHSILF
jgi:hypothetical protein